MSEKDPSDFEGEDVREITEAMNQIMRELGEHAGEYRRMLGELLKKRASAIEDFTFDSSDQEILFKMLEANSRSEQAFIMYLQAMMARGIQGADAATLLSLVFQRANMSQSWLDIVETGDVISHDVRRAKEIMKDWLENLEGDDAMRNVEDLFDELFWRRPRRYAPNTPEVDESA